MATIVPDNYERPPPLFEAQSQDPLFEALVKQQSEVNTQEISVPTQDSGAVTYGLQWPKDMNANLIIPRCSEIQGELINRGWEVTYDNFDALMLATFSMKLPEGKVTYPEKHMQDWEAVLAGKYGIVNLGLMSGDYDINALEKKLVAQE